ncbi:hypothetical protein DFH27DRAFT_543017 [Peziza echinospora]|nr:hypothetical protein DFH27DRAFT_543017 [Peziza echinospora]
MRSFNYLTHLGQLAIAIFLHSTTPILAAPNPATSEIEIPIGIQGKYTCGSTNYSCSRPRYTKCCQPRSYAPPICCLDGYTEADCARAVYGADCIPAKEVLAMDEV